jgi:thiol-disulfide isomerase/thioredoxin
MRVMKYFFTVLWLSLVLSVSAQTYPALQLSPQPATGRAVVVSYDPAGTVLSGQQPLRCSVVYFDKDHELSHQTLPLQQSRGKWQATLTVPEQAVLLLIIPAAGEKGIDDNNGTGYLFPVYKAGKPVPFAYYQMSQLMGNRSQLKHDPSRELSYLKKEMDNNPAAENLYRNEYFNMLANSPEPADKALLIQQLLAHKTDNEQELTMAQRYLLYLGESAAADSLAALLRHRFPAGIFVRSEHMDAIQQTKVFREKSDLFDRFMQQFPEPATAGSPDYEYTTLYQQMGMAALENGDTTAAGKYIARLKSKRDRLVFYNKAARFYQHQQQPDQAMSWAQKGVQATDTSMGYQDWDAYLMMASLYYDQHAYASGIPYAATAYVHTKSKEAGILYVQLLVAAGKTAAAQSLLEDAVRTGNAAVQMKAQLKDIYEKSGHPLPFAQYMATLLPAADTHLREELKAGMLQEKVTPISLLDTAGREVKLSDLKGKVVVLDFWATWCKPCIQSFPAMQQVMQQFPEVVFLFIATFETGNALQKVKQFSREKSFPFRYLMDEPLKGASNYKAFTHFKVPSVPYKLVLDKAGNIRFRSGGFQGNDDALITELSTMIRLAQD